MQDTLLFLDYCCPKPYDPSTLNGPGQGGTESTVTRLAEGLAKLGLFNVVVEQHNRTSAIDGEAAYMPIGTTGSARWVVCLRAPASVPIARKRFKNAKIYLYSHDVAGKHVGVAYQDGVMEGLDTNICVSDWHRNQMVETLRAFGFKGEFRNKRIYNPLSEHAQIHTANYDKNKLTFISSPHKGLDRALDLFPRLQAINPDFKLYVTNPGYYADAAKTGNSGIINLGSTTQQEAIRHVAESLCLFYPNTVFPETFGMVMSEANAVGTPVLTHPIGAAKEVLDSHPEQTVDCRDNKAVIDRVLKWWGGARPNVMARPEFKLHRVVQDWVRMLQDVR